MEKKYTIHILGIRAVDSETFDLPWEQNAVIVCTDHESKYIYQCLHENILTVNFADVQDRNHPDAFNRSHAKRIIGFIRNLAGKVTDIYVCCEQVASRSTAVVAGILRMSGCSDRDVWCIPSALRGVYHHASACIFPAA